MDTSVSCRAPWLVSQPLPAGVRARVREEAVFECYKWDPQVGDIDVILMQPLVLPRSEWDFLASAAEGLAAELLEAEAALWRALARERNRAFGELGLPGSIERVLRRACTGNKDTTGGLAPEAFRVMRFDFHHTSGGWRISEVNSDVPGGFVEASGVAALIASHAQAHLGGVAPAGDPAAAVARAFAGRLGAGASVGLVHATAYTDDRQAMQCLAQRLSNEGLMPLLLSPADARFCRGKKDTHGGRGGGEGCEAHDGRGWRRLDAMFRFFPGEWLPNLGWRSGWRRFFTGGCPSANPAWALVSQSKRFPLLWPRLGVEAPLWRRFLPETFDPRCVAALDDPQWVVKPALGRVGDAVLLAGVTPDATRRKHLRDARRHPHYWVAQRRFVPTPWETGADSECGFAPAIPPVLYPCVGVYVIDGRAAGAYGRASQQPLIEAHAHDVAVLIANEIKPAGVSIFQTPNNNRNHHDQS